MTEGELLLGAVVVAVIASGFIARAVFLRLMSPKATAFALLAIGAVLLVTYTPVGVSMLVAGILHAFSLPSSDG